MRSAANDAPVDARFRSSLRRLGARALAVIAFSAAVTASLPARGEGSRVDTSYGRIDGDLAVQGGLGATFGPRAPRATLDLRLRYMQTAGIFATYEDGTWFGASSEPRRAIATGIELRPLFLARWFGGLHTGEPYTDLTIDSFAFELGAVFMQPEGSRFGSRPGLQAGLGLAVPIFPNASGPLVGLHGGCRWSDSALGGDPLRGPSDRALYLNVTLAWQQIFGAHVVDMGDRARR